MELGAVMITLFSIIFLLFFMSIIIGLINPKLVLWWTPRQKRSVVMIFYTWGIVASAMTGVAFHKNTRSMGITMAIFAWSLWFGYWRKLRKASLDNDEEVYTQEHESSEE